MDPSTWAELCSIAGRRHGVISRAELTSLGIDAAGCRYLVRRQRLLQRAPRAFVLPGTTAGWHQELAIAQVDTGGVVSHRAAAALWGFDTFAPGPLEVSVARGRRIDRAAIVVRAATDLAADAVANGAFLATDPARTLLDLAAIVGRQRLEHAVDSAVRDRLVTVEVLRARLGARRASGRRGTRAMAEVLGDATAGAAESALERMFLRIIADVGLPTPRLQVVHERPGGGTIRVDAQYDDARVVIELDGHRFHATSRQQQRDAERTSDLELDGWVVLRFTYRDVVQRPGDVAAKVARALRRLAA